MKRASWAAIAGVAVAGVVTAARWKLPAHETSSPSVAPSAHHASAARKAPAPPVDPASIADGYDPAPYPHRTTSGSIAASNLTARIDSLTDWLKTDPANAGARRALMDSLLSRTQFFGTFSDFDRATSLVKPPSANSTAEELEAWAAVASALHDFKGALDALARAEAKDGKPRAAQRATIGLALGADLPAVLAARAKAAADAPGFETYAGLAAVQAAVGNYDAADATYRKALASYRDVSAFPVAWTEFQRGMMWAESAGRPDRAVPLYRAALARLPGYVVASVHLSEIEADSGDRASAVERLTALADKVEDPEPAAVLSKLLAESEPAESRRLAALAKHGYESLLSKHKSAFLDHAAEFFCAAGNDPRRGLALAEENLKLRPTDRAYALVIKAATAAGDAQRACTLAKEAGDARPSVPLRELRTRALKGCTAETGAAPASVARR